MFNRKGHFVQVNRPLRDRSKPHEWVEVAGRTISREADFYNSWNPGGWQNVSREMSKRDARKMAAEYKKAGFKVRVVFKGN